MKKLNIILFNIFIVILGTNFAIAGTQNPNLQEKVINKNYDKIDETTLLSIENKFGDINIETSKEQKTIEVEIIIQAWHKNVKDAKELLEQIQVSDQSSGYDVTLITYVPSLKNNNSKKGYKIMYNIKAPEKINADLENKYGSINTSAIGGDTNIVLAYGALKTGDLNGSSNEIKISYGSGEIDFIENGEIRTRYLSKLNIGQVNNLEIDDKYGNVYIGTAGFIQGESAYSNLEINTLRTALDYESDYGSIKVGEVGKDFEQINADSAYGSIKIGFSDKTDFKFEAQVRYGSFKNNIEGIEIMKSIEHNTSAEYTGYRLDKDSSKKIYVKSAYGSIKFN